jgi:hypothetical protein
MPKLMQAVICQKDEMEYCFCTRQNTGEPWYTFLRIAFALYLLIFNTINELHVYFPSIV